MPFDPDKYLATYNQRTAFKSPDIEEAYAKVSPELRDAVANAPAPLTVTSAYRDPGRNAAVGGVPGSYHTKGQAVDLRLGSDDQAIMDYFQGLGMQPIRESDHIHVEPGEGATKSTFDPDKYLADYRASEPEIMEPETQMPAARPVRQKGLLRKAMQYTPAGYVMDKSIDAMRDKSGLGTGLREYASAATAGLIEPVAAGVSAAAEEPLQWAGVLPERSIGESYRDYRQKGREDVQALREANPNAALVGTMAGVMSPGAAFSRIYKGLGGLGKGMKLMKGKEANALRRIVEESIRAGTANTVYQQLDPDARRGFDKIAEEFGLGAAFGAGGSVLGHYGGKATRFLKESATEGKMGPSLQKLARGKLGWMKSTEQAKMTQGHKAKVAEDKEVFRQMKDAAKEAKVQEKQASLEHVQGLKAADDITVGQNLDDAVKQYELSFGKDLQTISGKVMRRHGMKKVGVDKSRKAINSMLKKEGVMDRKGNILRDEIDNIYHPERKKFYTELADLSERLVKNPSLQTLNRTKQAIQDFAEFGKFDRSQWQKLYGKLSHSVKENLDDAIETLAGKEGKSFKAARAKYAERVPNLKKLKKATRKPNMEDIVSGAKSSLKPETIDATLKQAPELKKPLADAVYNNIINRAKSLRALKQMVKDYGKPRLKALLSKEQYASLDDAIARMEKAGKPLGYYAPPQALPKPEIEFSQINKIVDYLKSIDPSISEKIAERAIVPLAPALSRGFSGR